MDLPIFYNEEDEWKKVMLMYDSALKEVNTKLEILNDEFKLNHQYNPIEHITSRIKSPQSIAKKMRHNQKELTVENIVKYINDVAGIRIICSFTSDIYRIADLIANQSDVQVLKVKDYIMCPKPNGYTSYHMIISVPIFLSSNMVNVKVEIQIRTIAMDFWASLEHKIYYKFEGNAPERIRKELRECADIVAFLDHKMLSLNDEIKIFNHDNELEQHKETMSESFQNMLKDSYGTVVDEETEEVIKIDEGGVVFNEREVALIQEASSEGIENYKERENYKESETFEERENYKESETFEEKIKETIEQSKKESDGDVIKNKAKVKSEEKKTEGKFLNFFGLKGHP